MNIRSYILFAAVTLLVGNVHAAESMVIDSSHTYPHFKISHLGFSTMHGRFDTTEGDLVLDREGGGSKVDVIIQSASINTGHAKRDEHLRNEDFLNVMEFPTLEYHSNKISFKGDNSAMVEGELTMMGITKSVPLIVDHIYCATHPMSLAYTCGFNAKATLKRSDFGIKKYLPVIGDEIQIEIELEARVPTDAGAGPKK